MWGERLVWLRQKKTPSYNLKDAGVSILMGLGNVAVSIILAAVTWNSFLWAYSHRLYTIDVNVWTFPLLILADDFIFYWFHRLSHRTRIWWAAHVNHHSSICYNLSTALRQSWTDDLAFRWAFWLPLSFLGFDPRWVLLQKALNLLYQYWIHTELIDKMPKWFELVFNTPSHHRVHHGSNPEYLDCNYGGIFIFWDKLFRSFVPERKDIQIRYGLTKNIQTHDLLTVAFHEWFSLVKDLVDSKSPKQALRIALSGPELSRPSTSQSE